MNILIITANRFPGDDPAALREQGLARVMMSLGHRVVVAALGSYTGGALQKYRGIPYLSLSGRNPRPIARAADRLLYSRRLLAYLDSAIAFDAFLLGDVPLPVLRTARAYALRRRILLVCDGAGRHAPRIFPAGRLPQLHKPDGGDGPAWLDGQFRIIATGRTLQRYAAARNIPAALIPALLDRDDYPMQKEPRAGRLTLLWPGLPAGREALRLLIEGAALLEPNERARIDIRVLGVSQNRILGASGASRDALYALGGSLRPLGSPSREQRLRHLSQADFTVLLRPAARRPSRGSYLAAAAESLMSGTPLILGSGMGLGGLVTDGVEGMAVSECSAWSLCQTLRRALQLDADQRREMSRLARERAEKAFDCRVFAPELHSLLSGNQQAAADVSAQECRHTLCTVVRGRASRLRDIYDSLLRQDYPRDRFEWLIVDEGTFGAAAAAVAAMQAEDHLSIRLLSHDPGEPGAAAALAARSARGMYMTQMGDGEVLLDDALRRMDRWLASIAPERAPSFAGVAGLCLSRGGVPLGAVPHGVLDATASDFACRYPGGGRYAGCVRTDLLRRYPASDPNNVFRYVNAPLARLVTDAGEADGGIRACAIMQKSASRLWELILVTLRRLRRLALSGKASRPSS